MGIEPALGNNYAVEEEDTGAFLQADFSIELFGRGCAAMPACAT